MLHHTHTGLKLHCWITIHIVELEFQWHVEEIMHVNESKVSEVYQCSELNVNVLLFNIIHPII